MSLDSLVVRSAPYAVRFARTGERPEDGSTLRYQIAVTFTGDSLALRGWLRFEGKVVVLVDEVSQSNA